MDRSFTLFKYVNAYCKAPVSLIGGAPRLSHRFKARRTLRFTGTHAENTSLRTSFPLEVKVTATTAHHIPHPCKLRHAKHPQHSLSWQSFDVLNSKLQDLDYICFGYVSVLKGLSCGKILVRLRGHGKNGNVDSVE